MVAIKKEIQEMTIQADRAQTEIISPARSNSENVDEERPTDEGQRLELEEQQQHTSTDERKPTPNMSTFINDDINRHYKLKREQDKVRSREFRLKYGAHSPF